MMMTGKTNALPFHPRDGEGERGVKSGRNKETKKCVGMSISQATARSARRNRQDARRRHDRDEANLRRRDDDKVLFTRSTLPPALGYAPYLLALSPLTRS